MPIFALSGRAKPVKDALFHRVREAQRDGEHEVLLVVPAQYTLQAEMEALDRGSFRLQVLSPSRLYARIFDEAGWPKGARIDEQGRVMLVHAAAQRMKRALIWYQGAVGRKGFAEKVLAQIEGFKQARIGPADVRSLADAQTDPALGRKLMDLALLYEGYEAALLGRFLDGEDEARQAAARLGDARCTLGAEVFVYGFDILPQPLAETLVALAQRARHVTVAVAQGADRRDEDIYAPAQRSWERLAHLAREAGLEARSEQMEFLGSYGAEDIRRLEKELFCIPQRRQGASPKHIQLAAVKNPQDEAEFAAALVRQLVMDRGWRWREVAVMVQNLDDASMSALRRAFALADVPLFLPTARPADRHPAARCLLAALHLATRGWRTEDMVAYLRSGFTGLQDDQLDLLINHILARGLRGNGLKNPLRYLKEDQEPFEAWREAAVAPVLALERQCSGLADARAVLTNVFEFMDRLDLCGQIERDQIHLSDMGQLEWAAEGPQVYAKILAAMDQMAELLQGGKFTLRDCAQMMERALAVAEVKPLPQSGDAVVCGGVDHMKSQDVKALLMLGLTDQGAPADAALLSEDELKMLGEKPLTSALSAKDRLKMAQMSTKAALSFTEEYLMLSYPMSNARGEATKRGPLAAQVKRIFPGLKERGGQVSSDADRRMRHMRLNAPLAALNRLPAMLRETPNDPYLVAMRDALGEDGVDAFVKDPDALPKDLAKRLFGELGEVSVTRLEAYAACPYKHFARYALRPEPFREFELTPRDTGDFYHAAMERFIKENGARLGDLEESECTAQMDLITEPLMADLVRDALGEGAVARAQGEELRKVARRAAATVVHQLRGSEFEPVGLEIDFGKQEPKIELDSAARLGGRIDRVDSWSGEGGKYLRVIDYKTNGKTLNLSEVYYGLQMQLMVYLAAATKLQGGKPAGAFYFNLSDSMVDTEARTREDVEVERAKKLKLKGVMVKDDAVKAAMSDHSDEVLPVRGDGVMEEGDVRRLMAHTMEKVDEIYDALKAGGIGRRPAEIGGHEACEVCDYSAMCQRTPADPPRKLQKLKATEILSRLRTHPDS